MTRVPKMFNSFDGDSCNVRIGPDTLASNEKLRDPLVPFRTLVLLSRIRGEADSAIQEGDTLCTTFNCRHFGSLAFKFSPPEGFRR